MFFSRSSLASFALVFSVSHHSWWVFSALSAATGVPACAAFEPEVLLVQVQVDGPVDVAESGRVAAERCCVR